ncbi:MAG: TOBE domain-containing protein [Acetobacteraceae bacterium]
MAGFIGAANLLPVTVGEGAVRLADGQMLAVPPGHSPADGPAQLVLRPEHLIPADAPAPGRALRARLDSALFLGAVVQTRFMLGETELRVRLSPDRVRGLAVGDIVTLAVDIDRAVLVP